jgi:hypothetical protein
MQTVRKTFGSVVCEIFVNRTAGLGESGFVARALRIQDDGRADVLYDERGCLYRATADIASQAILVLCAQLTARFGAEAPLLDGP